MKDLVRKYRYRLHGTARAESPPPDVVASVRQRVFNRHQRRQMRELLTCNDHILADVGLSRHDINRSFRGSARVRAYTGMNNIHQQILHPEQPGVLH